MNLRHTYVNTQESHKNTKLKIIMQVQTALCKLWRFYAFYFRLWVHMNFVYVYLKGFVFLMLSIPSESSNSFHLLSMVFIVLSREEFHGNIPINAKCFKVFHSSCSVWLWVSIFVAMKREGYLMITKHSTDLWVYQTIIRSNFSHCILFPFFTPVFIACLL